MPSIAQLSDAHLAAHQDLFRDHLAAAGAWLAAHPPTLIVASGDLALDGADTEADLAISGQLHAALPAPVLSIPGNHDIGDYPELAPRQPTTSARLARFRQHCGDDFWMRDLDAEGGIAWRLIGLDSQIMGQGLPEEDAQRAFLAEALASAGERRLALFIHKPVFVDPPGHPGWAIPPASREELAPLLEHPHLRLVASGHLHLHHQFRRGQVDYCWAPALSFLVEAEMQGGLPGDRVPGFLMHELHADRAETRLVQPEGISPIWLESVRAQTYPR